MLVVDADEAIGDLLARSGRVALRHATTATAALTALAEDMPDCLLLDLGLTDALPELQRLAAYVPVVALASREDDDFAVKAIRAGAQDCLVKATVGAAALRRAIACAIERHRAQEELRRSKAAKTPILDATLDAVITIDSDNRVIEFNPAAEVTFGHVRADVLGRDLADLIVPPRLRELERRSLARSFCGEAGLRLNERFEITGVRADGNEFPIELTIVPTGGEPPTYTGFLRDLTGQRRSEEAAARLAAIVESSEDAILAKDLEGVVTSWNAAAERLYGYSAEEAVGRNVGMLIPDPRETEHILDELRAGRPLRAYETVRRRRDGSLVDVSVSASPVRDATGRVVGGSAIVRDITARRRAEAAMRLSEWRHRMLISQLPDAAICQYDRELRLVLAEGALLDRLGWQADVGREVRDVLAPGRADEFEAHCRAALAGSIQSFEWESVDVGLTLDVDIVPMPDDDGVITGVMALVRDVTPRTEAARRLHFQAQLLDRLDVALLATDLDGRVTHWNRQAERYYQLPRARAIGRSIHEIKADYGLPHVGPVIERLVAGETWQEEVDVRRPDGEVIPMLVNTTAVRDDEAGVVGFASVQVDVSAAREAASQLYRARELFESAFAHAPVGFAVVSASPEDAGALLRVNDAICRMLRRDPQSLLGTPFADLVHDDDLAHLRPSVEWLLGSEASALHHEVRLKRPDGGTFWCRLSVALVRDEAGTPQHAVALLQDLTAEREAQAEKQRLATHLQQAQKLDSIGRLAGGIAHDFNNILAVILTYTDFVADGLAEDAPVRDDVEQIRDAAERAAALTRQLLTFGRREVVQPRAQDLNEIVAETEMLLRRTIGEDVRLVTDLTSGLARVRVDQSQIEQVLLNLALNARDAMPGGGDLTIATSAARRDDAYAAKRPGTQAGDYVQLTVADTGVGMSAEVARQAFEPFFTTKPAGAGTGLGLATVYGIVTQAGGCVELHSEPGEGTVIRVLLPISREAEQPAETVPEPLELSGSGETILVVEDEPEVRLSAVRVLEEGGYRVVSATSAGEALAMATTIAPALVLTDVVMPGMSGSELATAVAERWPAVKVLLMSGYTDDVVMRHGVSERRVAFLEKPFTRAGLLTAVRGALDA